MSSRPTDEMTCRDFVELVTDLIEGRLPEPQRLEAEAHMGRCEGCATYFGQVRQTIDALRRLADAEDFPRTREQALTAFRELRGPQAAQGGGPPG